MAQGGSIEAYSCERKTGSLMAWNSPSRLGWWASKPGISLSLPQCWGYKHVPLYPVVFVVSFLWVLGIKFRSLPALLTGPSPRPRGTRWMQVATLASI